MVSESNRPMSDFAFKIMSVIFKIRDLLRPRMDLLKEANIRPGFTVLDYGCGPGSYIAPLAELVGASGLIYALDIHPLAIRAVRDIVRKRRLANVKTIESDCETGLDDGHLDAIVLYDTFHDLARSEDVLRELHRVLKPNGILSFSDHHMAEDEINVRLTTSGLFRLLEKGERTYSFTKVT